MSTAGLKSRATFAQTLRSALAVALLGLAASCASGPEPTRPPVAPPPPPIATPPGQPPSAPILTSKGVTPQFMAGRDILRVGLLLPFGSLQDESHALYQAAELGVFDFGGANTLLIPRESGATPEEAANQTRLLLRDGADVILGPVQRDSVQSAAQVARQAGVPVIGFSSDREIAGDGVYILSLPLEEDVRRITEFAMSKGMRSIALLAPDSAYGERVAVALRADVAQAGGVLVAEQRYSRSEQAAAAAARLLGARLKTAPAQAILIADSGAVLRAIGPALLMGGVNPSKVKLLGTSAWSGPDVLREPTLAGGWYPAPDPTIRAAFEARYRAAYGPPSRFASLGYDAVRIAAEASGGRGGHLARSAIERGTGFNGADGVIRFRRDGSIERGLAILQVGQGAVDVVDPAPRGFAGS